MVRIHPDPPSDTRPANRIGAIAQLGERLLCKQEVTGSIPVGSTRIDATSSAECIEKGEPFSVHFVLFGCSLKIRKKQGGSGPSNGRTHWVRYCISSTSMRLSRPRARQAQRESCSAAPRNIRNQSGAHRYRVK